MCLDPTAVRSLQLYLCRYNDNTTTISQNTAFMQNTKMRQAGRLARSLARSMIGDFPPFFPSYLASATPSVGWRTGDWSRPNTCLATPTTKGSIINAWAACCPSVPALPPPPGEPPSAPASGVQFWESPKMKLDSQSRRSARASAKPLIGREQSSVKEEIKGHST